MSFDESSTRDARGGVRHAPTQRRRHVRRHGRGDRRRLADDEPGAHNLASGTLNGATWIVGAGSTMSLGANITTDAATIILNGAGASFSSLSPLAKIGATGTLEVLGGGSFPTAGNLDNAGTIDLAPGILNVTGNYTQESTGAFDVAVGGVAAGTQFGQLTVTKQATLNGSLSVSLINGYTPAQGDSYQVLTFASETGNFSAEFGLYLGNGEGFTPTFNPSTNPTALDLVIAPQSLGTQTTVAVFRESLELRRFRHLHGHGAAAGVHRRWSPRAGHFLRRRDRDRHRDSRRRLGLLHHRRPSRPGRTRSSCSTTAMPTSATAIPIP